MDRALKSLLERKLGSSVEGQVRQHQDQTEVRIRPGDLPQVMRILHDEPDLHFEYLADLCGVDTGTTFQVVYHLWGEVTPDWLRVIVDGIPHDQPRIPSITFLWKGAEWLEREAYDMFGLVFEGNRDLRRIYLPDDFGSFPLRKDFHLPDDAARSPGGGLRPMERAGAPRDADETTMRRTSPGT
ncbi:MAG: NADH-quinone oxidoreductase subunit C [Chloroflexota bacterium]